MTARHAAFYRYAPPAWRKAVADPRGSRPAVPTGPSKSDGIWVTGKAARLFSGEPVALRAAGSAGETVETRGIEYLSE